MARKTPTTVAALVLLAGLAGLTGVTACATQSGGTAVAAGGAAPAASSAALACPRHPPGSRAGVPVPAAAAQARQLVPAAAVTAVICQYALHPSAKTSGLVPRIALAGGAAQGLAAVLDSAAVVAGQPPRCASPGPFAQIIVFSYRTGPAVTASVQFGCTATSGLVTVGASSGVTSQALDADLFALTEARPPGSGPATPDLIGLGAAAAARAAARHGFTLAVDGAAPDAEVPLGTVIFQALPPGAVDAVPGGQVDVMLAVPRAPACTAAQLAMSYRDGGLGAGSDFGGIAIRDVSAAACQLAGPVSVTGLDASGRPVTETVAARFASPGVLSPHGPIVPDHDTPPPGDLEYWMPLGAEYRDGDTPSGLCPRQLTPAAWRVTLAAGGFTVRGSLITCEGRLMSISAPSYWTT